MSELCIQSILDKSRVHIREAVGQPAQNTKYEAQTTKRVTINYKIKKYMYIDLNLPDLELNRLNRRLIVKIYRNSRYIHFFSMHGE